MDEGDPQRCPKMVPAEEKVSTGQGALQGQRGHGPRDPGQLPHPPQLYIIYGLLHVDPREMGLADIDAAGLAPLASLFG